jgi:hypothetical protein
VLAGAFAAVSVKISCAPTVGVADDTVFETVTTANDGVTVTLLLEPLVAPTSFGTACVNVAVFVDCAELATVTTIVRVAVAPGAKSSIVHVTVCPETLMQAAVQVLVADEDT